MSGEESKQDSSSDSGVVTGNMDAPPPPDHTHADLMGKIADLQSHDHGVYEATQESTETVPPPSESQGPVRGGALKKKKKSMKKKSKSKSKKNKTKSKKMKKNKSKSKKMKKMKKRGKRRMKGGSGTADSDD
uniref:Uncharacterized protein n=1 Tax=Florenciella sp. virus SA2 TaxID=3240092 RepID=A0AB39J820_9VIRU